MTISNLKFSLYFSRCIYWILSYLVILPAKRLRKDSRVHNTCTALPALWATWLKYNHRPRKISEYQNTRDKASWVVWPKVCHSNAHELTHLNVYLFVSSCCFIVYLWRHLPWWRWLFITLVIIILENFNMFLSVLYYLYFHLKENWKFTVDF